MFHRGKIILIYQYMKWMNHLSTPEICKASDRTINSSTPISEPKHILLHFVPKRWNEPGADTELEKLFKNSDAVE